MNRCPICARPLGFARVEVIVATGAVIRHDHCSACALWVVSDTEDGSRIGMRRSVRTDGSSIDTPMSWAFDGGATDKLTVEALVAYVRLAAPRRPAPKVVAGPVPIVRGAGNRPDLEAAAQARQQPPRKWS